VKGVSIPLTDANVVAYNPYLSLKYNTHINVEWIGSQQCLEYIYKYIMKGSEMAYVRLKSRGVETGVVDFDEWQGAKTCYRSAQEAMDRIYSHAQVFKSHTVACLYVHLPAAGAVIFNEGYEAEALAQAVFNQEKKSTLTAYFKKCETELEQDLKPEQRATRAAVLHYHDMPKHYTFDAVEKVWNRRQVAGGAKTKGLETIVRIGSVSPRNLEATAIRALLLSTPGAAGWEHLRTVRWVFDSTVSTEHCSFHFHF
jgi:hypothetical protein